MRKKLLLTLLMVWSATSFAQNYTSIFFYNLMDEKTYDYIVGEASGDLSYNQLVDMAGYEKDRTNAQYADMLHESKYMLERMEEYGLAGAKLERFNKTRTWDGISASLWETSPKTSKIADYKELAAFLGQGSVTSDVEAELVWIGRGTEREIAEANVAGKIVVTESSGGAVHDRAVAKGAVGVVSFGSVRPLVDPIQVPNSGIRSSNPTFLFNLPPRDGDVLKKRLLAGEKIKVHAKVEAQNVELDIQVPTCYIQGSDPNAEEVVFVAHIYEGYVKLGANDNTSGVTSLLDVARTLNTLINEGKIERPKRTMRFIWVPEFSGTGPWVHAHKDITEKSLCAINLDMVGLWLSKSNSYFNLNRTTMGNPHYLSDVAESFFHYMGITNKEWTSTGVGRPLPMKPVYSTTGSRDPFYYSINHHYGASDHEVFNDWGVQVPSVIFITWTDNYYHTSGDRPSIIDPTQMKRSTVLAAATGYYIANANEDDALKIVSEVSGNAVKRLGLYQARGSHAISTATEANLIEAYKKALSDVEAMEINEKDAMNSVTELAPTSARLEKHIDNQILAFGNSVKNTKTSLEDALKTKAEMLGVSLPKKFTLSKEEQAAAKIFPKPTAKVKESGYGVLRQLSQPEITSKYKFNVPNSSEAAKLTTLGNKSILDIQKMLEAQFPQEVKLSELVTYFEALKAAGLVTY